MTRYKLILEYDGGGFVGWQRQDNGPSVQAALEEAVRGFCGESVTAHAAGRTDAGVHALAMATHIDLEKDTDTETLRDALNAHLRPAPVAVLSAEMVAPDFHARFSASSRAYLYRIVNRRAPLAMDRGRAWWVPVPLDAAAMHEAAQVLIGHHDFSSFRSSECQAKSPVKTLDRLEVARDGEDLRVTAEARSFLHNQVRILVGTLKRVGEGKWTRADLKAALDARDRTKAGQTAPPEGLYFLRAGY
jgi:tRNA pseudouridine38-40 synthase